MAQETGPAPLLTWRRKQGGSAAIVFIHGFSGDPEKTWLRFGELLRDSGRLDDWDIASLRYQTRLVPDLAGIWSADAPIARLAGMLSTALSHGELADYRAVALVAHSMGGLVAQRAILDDAETERRISHLFLLGTPSGGLVKAWFAQLFKRQAADMARSSAFITALRSDWSARFGGTTPFKLFVVAGETDEFVPPSSSLAPFAKSVCFVVPGNHIEICKPDRRSHPSCQLVLRGLMGEAAPAGPWNAARVALEMGDFRRTIELFGERQKGLDAGAAVTLALALDAVGRNEEAIAVLARHVREDTDAMGTLAGRFKRRWLLTRQAADAALAIDLYERGYRLATAKRDHAQAYYHAINRAFMALVARNDRRAATAAAQEALRHAAKAPRGMWRSATQAEAALIMGDTDRAIKRYGEALGQGPQPREIASMYQQALRIAHALADKEAAERIERLFRPDAEAARPGAPVA